MTEQTGFPEPDSPFSVPAPVAPVAPEAANAAAADQLAAAAAATPAGDAGLTVAQIREQAQREVLLPMESKIDALMAELNARSAQQDREIAQLRAALASAQQQVGPPEVVTLGQAAADRLEAAAASTPHGLPRAHFAPALAIAGDLADAAKDAAQTGQGTHVRELAAKLNQWITRGHVRASGGVPVEHFPALLDDLERLAEAAAKLVPQPAAAAAPAAG